jgi:hypothetical protein
VDFRRAVVASRTMSLGVVLLGWSLAGCATKSPPEGLQIAVSDVAASHISVDTSRMDLPETHSKESVQRAEIRSVLESARAAAGTCYGAAVRRSPDLHGEIIVRFSLAAAGTPLDVAASLATVTDAQMVACVESVVGGLTFPRPIKQGLVVRYPFVFTSDRTPPEVTRALLIRYGLLPPTDTNLAVDFDKKPTKEKGTYQTW